MKARRIYASASARCTSCTQIDPSPTALATRFTLSARTSPTANTAGMLVSISIGRRASGHLAVTRSSALSSAPVFTKR